MNLLWTHGDGQTARTLHDALRDALRDALKRTPSDPSSKLCAQKNSMAASALTQSVSADRWRGIEQTGGFQRLSKTGHARHRIHPCPKHWSRPKPWPNRETMVPTETLQKPKSPFWDTKRLPAKSERSGTRSVFYIDSGSVESNVPDVPPVNPQGPAAGKTAFLRKP